MLQQIRDDLKNALRSGDRLKLNVLRGLLSAIQNAEIEKKAQLSEQEIIALLQKEQKKRNEAAQLYDKAGETDRKQIEIQENEIIKSYLPEQMSRDEVAGVVGAAISQTGAETIKDMGKVMAVVKSEIGAKADGGLIAEVTKAQLGNK